MTVLTSEQCNLLGNSPTVYHTQYAKWFVTERAYYMTLDRKSKIYNNFYWLLPSHRPATFNFDVALSHKHKVETGA